MPTTTGAPPAPTSLSSGSFQTPSAAPASQAAAAQPAAARAASSGFDWKTAGLLGLGAAPLALTLARGESPLPPQAAQLQAQTATTNAGIAQTQAALAQQNAPIQAAANTYLAGVQSNSPTVQQAAQLAQQQQSLTNQWRQALFNQGVQNPESDTRWPQIQAQINEQMNASAQSMIQTNLQAALGLSNQSSSNIIGGGNLGVAGGQQASQNLIALANLQVQQDTAFTNAITSATKALGTVAALGAVSKIGG